MKTVIQYIFFLTLFLIPYSKSEQVPIFILSLVGYYLLFRNKLNVKEQSYKRLIILYALFYLPILISIPNGLETSNPLKCFLIGTFITLPAGLATIYGFIETKNKRWHQITFISIIGFWVLDAFFQWITGFNHIGIAVSSKGINGPFTDWGQYAYYVGPMTGLLFFPLVLLTKKRALLLSTCLLVSWTLFLSTRRGGIIMHFVVLSIFLWKMYLPLFKRKIPIIILICTIYTALILLCNYAYEPFSERIKRSTKIVHLDQKETFHALTGRPKIWALSFAAFKESPITGIGARNFGRSKEYPRFSHPHHAHLEILVGSGVLGLVSFLFINLLIINWWIKSSPASKMQAWPFISYLAASFFPLTSHRSIYATELSLITFLFAAMAMACLRDKQIKEFD